MSSEENTDWIHDKTEWLKDKHFPYESIASMLTYLRTKSPESFIERVEGNSTAEMPQSYAHWWCNKLAVKKGLETYPLMERWRKRANAWWEKEDAEDAEIIAMFQTWLDLLFIDLTTFPESEMHRKGVPILYRDWTISCDIKIAGKKRARRRRAVRYIVDSVNDIFKERGYTEGLQWWEDESKLIMLI